LSTDPSDLGPFDPAKQPRAASDTSFEVELDEEPARRHEPVYVDVVSRDDELLPIVPANWRTWDNARISVRRIRARWWHIARWHAVRAPWHGLLLTWFALVGVFRLAGRQLRWWWVAEQDDLRQRAATDNEPEVWSKLTDQARAIRLYRGIVLLGEVAGLVVVLVLLHYSPGWVTVLLVVVAVPLLARAGRPGRRVIGSAVVAHRYRKLNSDIVLRAYYAAGLGHPDKVDQRVDFGSVMARDGDGSRVVVDLPFGTTYDDAVKAKGKIASGLDVSLFQVFLTKDRSSHRRHVLWVADQDPLAIPAGKTPLLDCKPRDIWEPLFAGLDERATRVTLFLLWISILVGAQPRKGKTFTARLMALYAALDPYVRITIADGKNSPDWAKFRLVAHRMIFGTVPNSNDSDPVNNLLDALREIKAHIEQVNDFLSTLPVTECPEGKLTRELSRRYPHLRVWLLVVEEFQLYFETDDQDTNKEIAKLLSFIMAVGPSAGVILLSSSQKPSGVGAGDVQRLFNRYRDNHTVRIALKCGNRDVSMAVLGGDAYQEGYDASALPVGPEYRGVGYLYGASDDTPLVRWHLADAEDAAKILLAARAHRDRLGLLTGMAAGEDMTRDLRDVLRDVRCVFYAGEAWVSWPQIAARLAEQMPEHYSDMTAEAASAQVRALKVPSVDGRDKADGNRVVKGAKLKDIDAAMKRRELADV
jgi:DNA segregation ATPase FtsK/SpoIIIE, S-DNA-T family